MFSGLWRTTSKVSIKFMNYYVRKSVSDIYNTPRRCFCGISNNNVKKKFLLLAKKKEHKFFSNGILDGDLTKPWDQETKKTSSFFPNPRVTLNELITKLPHKVFDMQYRQTMMAPKISKVKKKSLQSNLWICNYLFVWPEKMKFESTAQSKKQAAEQAASQAVHWLHENGYIDRHGKPVYSKEEINKITSEINKPFCANISDGSVERIQRIWTDYEEGIKDIYEKTHVEAIERYRNISAAVCIESSIDSEDEFSDGDTESSTDPTSNTETFVHPVFGRVVAPSSDQLRRRDRKLQMALGRYGERDLLPADEYSDQIISALDQSRTLVLIGSAGCGKSTRIPTLVLSHYGSQCNAIVSEPRRVAAISLANRVASEMAEEVGETIGYQVRLKSCPPSPPGGAILYCTSGVLLNRLQKDPALRGCTHVFIDEAHERDVNTDLTLLLLKRALSLNNELKVVVMSATLNADVFVRYFDTPQVIEIPGRTYPVEAIYLDEIRRKYNIELSHTLEVISREDEKPIVNCNEITQLIKAIDKREPEGGILVFLPGWTEIKTVQRMLEKDFQDFHLVIPVHSRLSSTDQSKMFARPLPGVRKIVLATNIAETSLTIPDIVYVIDCGAHKENRVLRTGTASLDTVWISQAAAKQRMGRAGRVQPGHCFKMYTREKEAEFNEHSTPEILRVPLEQVILECKRHAPSEKVEGFLSRLPEPPSKEAIRNAITDLVDLGALNQDDSLTPLGHKISALPLEPRSAAALLQSAVTCNAESVAYTVGDVDVGSGERSEIRELKRKYSNNSDHAALYYIQDEFEREPWETVHSALRKDRMEHAKALTNLHLQHLLTAIPLRNQDEIEQINLFSNVKQMLAAALLAGGNKILFIKKRLSSKGRLRVTGNVYSSTGERVHISSESVNYNMAKASNNDVLLTCSGTRHSVARGALIASRTSVIMPETVLLFARGCLQIDSQNDGDDCKMRLTKHNLEVTVSKNVAEVIEKAREMLWRTFQFYYERDLETLDEETEDIVFRFKMRLVKAIGRILLEADKEVLEDEQ